MTKKRAKKLFILIAIVVFLFGILTFVSFPIPFTINGVSYNYECFVDKIKLGLDLKGGVTAVYTATMPEDEDEANYNNYLESTISGLSEILSSQGYTEAVVTKQGTNSIRVEVPDVDDPETLLSLIGEPAILNMKEEDSADAEAFLTGKNIKSVEAQYNSNDNVWGVSISFDSEGSRIFAEKTEEISSSSNPYVYIYLGSTRFSSGQVEEAITGGTTFISGGSITDQTSAEEYALKIQSGTFLLSLSKQSSSIISPTLGINALKYGIIAGVIGLVLIMLFMWLVYGHFGLLADFSLFIYIVLMLFFLQAIPGVQLTLPGIAGIILSIGMAVDANIIIFERIRDEYKKGKTFVGSIKQGFKKSVSAILDANITTILAATILAILGTGSIRGFAFTLLIGLVISIFCSLVVTRGFLKMYMPLNFENAKKARIDDEGRLLAGEVTDEK